LPERDAGLFVAAVDQPGLRLGIIDEIAPGDRRPRLLFRRQGGNTRAGVPAATDEPAPACALMGKQRKDDRTCKE